VNDLSELVDDRLVDADRLAARRAAGVTDDSITTAG